MVHKILLIDDSLTQLGVLKIQLVKNGFEVETASCALDGYKKVFSFAPDLILSDVIMPDLNGYQLCRLLKNDPITNKIPVILLTILDKKIDEFWSNKSGANKFISKTAEFDEIVSAINAEISSNLIEQDYRYQILQTNATSSSVQNQINNILDELLMNTTLLNEFRKLNEFIPQEKVLIDKIFELLSSFLDFKIAGVFFNAPTQIKTLHLSATLEESIAKQITESFFKSYAINDYDCHMASINSDMAVDFEQELILPIKDGDKILGGICFYELNTSKKNKAYQIMLEEFVILFRTKAFHDATQHLSITDGLTGLYNRRHFDFNLEREFSRTKRYPCDLSLAIIDIDNFKSINDKFGHQFGDYALKSIAKILHKSFRKTDMIYRYGGEELAIILTETSMENAKIPLERLKEAIAQYEFIYGSHQCSITVSIGLSSNFETITTEKCLLESADKALYQAKQTGKNKLVSVEDEQS